MALTTLTSAELYQEIADLARDQGAATKDIWDELVEEVIESHLSLGEIDLDEDTEGLKETLRTKWDVYRRESAAEEDGADVEVVGSVDDEDEDEGDEKEELEGFGEQSDDEV